jgi:putative tryptophan/tyrosine transport system substrate-binding protein
LTVASNLPV